MTRNGFKTLPQRGLAKLRRTAAAAQRDQGKWPAGHYYSPVPDFESLAADADRIFRPRETLPGISLDVESQLNFLRSLASSASLYTYGTDVGTDEHRRFVDPNGWFQGADARVLFGICKLDRPDKIIEVGSGYSSALMLDTLAETETELTFIEPFPDDRLTALLGPSDVARVSVLAHRAQDCAPEWYAEQLATGDILFIDSSHVVKTDSDVNHLLLEVLPQLRAGVRVHIHDIFFPFEYPRSWVEDGYAWNESYLLRALLTHSTRYRIDVFNDYLFQMARAEAETAFPGWSRSKGSSVWLTIAG